MMTDRQPKPEYMERATAIMAAHGYPMLLGSRTRAMCAHFALALEDEAARARSEVHREYTADEPPSEYPSFLSPAVEGLVRAAEAIAAYDAFTDPATFLPNMFNLRAAIAAIRSQSEGAGG